MSTLTDAVTAALLEQYHIIKSNINSLTYCLCYLALTNTFVTYDFGRTRHLSTGWWNRNYQLRLSLVIFSAQICLSKHILSGFDLIFCNGKSFDSRMTV